MKVASQSATSATNPFSLPAPSQSSSASKITETFRHFIHFIYFLESLIEQLDNPDGQRQAIRSLNDVVDFYWPEISEVSHKM